jgi:hypothetical protein
VNEETDTTDQTTKPSNSATPIQEAKPVSAVPPQPTTERDLKQIKNDMSNFERSTLRWTKVTVLVVFATMLFVGLQWNEMRTSSVDTHDLAEAAKTQAEALKTAQRAFVTFSPDATVATEVGTGGKVISWQLRIPMKNDSPTATQELRDCPTVANLPRGPIPKDFGYPDSCEPRQVPLGPRGQVNTIPKNILIADIRGVQRKERSIYVYGWATYRDVFPHSPKHVTLFCYELIMNTIKADLRDINYNLSGTLMLCEHHNCQDEDCKDEVLPKGFEPN